MSIVPIVTLLGILIPSLLIALAIRRWFAPLPWSIIAISIALTLGFLHGAVFTTRVPVPLDEVMRGYPYRGVLGAVESRNPLTNDTVKQILPWMQVAREELRAGRAPLWNRYQFSGYPLLGNGQSAPFAPIFLATLFVPLPHQIVAMAGLKIFLALLFAWLFLRDEGVSHAAALFGAAIFAFSVFQTVYLYYPMTTVSSLLPAAAFAVRGCVRDGSRRWIVLLAIVTAAVASGGHPESALHIGLACGTLLLIEWRNPTRAIAAAMLGAAIAAPAWVPVVEQALRSVRAAALAATPHGAMDRNLAWLFLNPDGFGNPSRGNWNWIYNYAIVAPTYLGLLPLALLFGAKRRREIALVIASVILFLVAMNWTILGRAINAIPPMSLVAQDRLRFVIVFFVAIVAALQTGDCIRVAPRRDDLASPRTMARVARHRRSDCARLVLDRRRDSPRPRADRRVCRDPHRAFHVQRDVQRAHEPRVLPPVDADPREAARALGRRAVAHRRARLDVPSERRGAIRIRRRARPRSDGARELCAFLRRHRGRRSDERREARAECRSSRARLPRRSLPSDRSNIHSVLRVAPSLRRSGWKAVRIDSLAATLLRARCTHRRDRAGESGAIARRG